MAQQHQQIGIAQLVAQDHRRRKAAQQRRHRLAVDVDEGVAAARSVEHQHALEARLADLAMQAQRQRLAVAAHQPHGQRYHEGLAAARRLLDRQRVSARRSVVAAAGIQVRGARLRIPAFELRQMHSEFALRVGVGNRLREVVAGHGLAVVALEIQRHSAREALAADQRLHHANHLGAFFVDGGGVEVVDLLIAVGAHRMRHRTGVLGELHLAQLAHVFDALDGTSCVAARHVHAEFLIAKHSQAFFQAQLEPVAAGDAVAGPVVKVLVADHAFDAGVVDVGGGGGAGQHELGVEDVQPLVLHGAHVEVAHRHDHEAVQIQRQLEARLVPHHAGDQRIHGVLGLVEIATPHIDLQQVIAPSTGANALLARHQIGGHQREQVARLGKGVMPHGLMAPAFQIGLLHQIAVAQQHRIDRLARAQRDSEHRHHIRPVKEIGDAAKALGLALREQPAARGVQARQLRVFVGRAGVADLEREGLVGQTLNHQKAVLLTERHALPVGQHAQHHQVVAMQPQGLRRHGRVALDQHAAGDQRARRVQVEGQIDGLDPERRRDVVLAADQGGGVVTHGQTPCFRLASMKGSRSPSSTFCVAETS